jgi:hypothetical protein
MINDSSSLFRISLDFFFASADYLFYRQSKEKDDKNIRRQFDSCDHNQWLKIISKCSKTKNDFEDESF